MTRDEQSCSRAYIGATGIFQDSAGGEGHAHNRTIAVWPLAAASRRLVAPVSFVASIAQLAEESSVRTTLRFPALAAVKSRIVDDSVAAITEGDIGRKLREKAPGAGSSSSVRSGGMCG